MYRNMHNHYGQLRPWVLKVCLAKGFYLLQDPIGWRKRLVPISLILPLENIKTVRNKIGRYGII